MKTIREIIFYKHYFDDFFGKLPPNIKEKVDEVLFMFTILDRIPSKYLKKIQNIKGLLKSV